MSRQPRTSASLSATSSSAMGLRTIHAGLRLEDAPSRSSSRFGDSFLDTSWRIRRGSSYVSGAIGSQEHNLRRQRRRWVEMRLFAYREDLADWFSNLFDVDISESSLVSEIEDGILLCRLARMVDSRAAEGVEATRGYAVGHERRRSTGHTKLRYNSKAAKGTFFARDNVSTFIAWARGLGIDDTVLFETSDLVELKNEKNVLYCLMEIARVQTALEPPSLIKLERSIDRNGYIAVDTEALEAAITAQCSRLDTPRSRVVRKGPALYEIDGHEYYLALIRDRVLVRTGKHWDPLEHVLTQPVEQSGASTSTPAATASLSGSGAGGGGDDTAASSPRRGPPSGSSSAFLPAPDATLNTATGPMSASGLGPASPDSRGAFGFASQSGSSDVLRPPVLQDSLHGPTLPAEDDRQDLLDEIAELQQRVADLEADLTQAEGLCDSERRAHEDTRRRLVDLEESMAGQPTPAAMEELEKANSLSAQRLQECIDDMAKMRDDHLASLEEKNRDIDERDRIIEDLRAKGETFESSAHKVEPEAVEKLHVDLSHAHRAAAEERERAAALRTKADAHDDLKRKYEDAMSELQDALARICQLEDMIRSLQQMDADRAASAVDVAERVQELGDALAAREAENKALQEETEAAKAEAAAMKQKTEQQQEDLDGLNEALAAAQIGAAAAQEELDATRKEQENWKAEGGRMGGELQEARAAVDARAKEVEDLQRKLDEARKKNDDLHFEAAERDADIGKLKDDVQAAVVKSDEQRAAAQGLQQEVDALKSKLQAKEEETDRLRGDLDNTEREKGRTADDMTRALSECTEARSGLEERIAALEVETGERDTEIVHLRALLNEANAALEEERAAAAALKRDNDDKAAEVSTLKQSVASLEGDIASLRQEAAASAEATEQLNSTLQRSEADAAAKAEDLESTNARLEELEALLATKDADAEFGAKEAKGLQDELQQLQIKYNLLQEGMLNAERKCEEDKSHLRDDRDRAIDDVVMLEDLNGRLMEEIQALEERCSALTQRLQQHEEELNALRGLAHESEDAIKTLRQQKEEAEEEAVQNKEGLDAAQAHLDEIEEAKRLEEEEQEEEERRRREAEEAEARAQAESDRAAQEEHERAMAMLEHDKELQKQNLELAPIRDDIASWINELLGTNMQGPALFHELQSGTVLCQLANIIDEHEEETRMQDEANHASGKNGTHRKTSISSSASPSGVRPGRSPRTTGASSAKTRGGGSNKAPKAKPKPPHHPLNETYACLPAAHEPIRHKRRRIPRFNYKLPEAQSVLAKYIKTRNIPYCPFEPKATPGTGKARQNVGNFLGWTRSLGLDNPPVFRDEDLLRMEDPRRVLWGLLDVARCTRRMRVPRIVWLERLRYIVPTKPVKDDSLDQAVRTVVNKSINQPRLRVTRIAEGKYTFGEEMTKPLLMRITKQNVLVRVGGGWQALSKYLQTHFPPDPKMKDEKDRFEPLWEENREEPQQFDTKDGHKMNLHTTRADILFHA